MSDASITAWSINRLGEEKKQEFLQQVGVWLGDEEKVKNTFEVRFDRGKKTATIFWYVRDKDGELTERPDGQGVEYEHETVSVKDFDHAHYDGAYVSAEMWANDD